MIHKLCLFIQLISSDTDGAGATTAGRFRVETGEREGEEVNITKPLLKSHY